MIHWCRGSRGESRVKQAGGSSSAIPPAPGRRRLPGGPDLSGHARKGFGCGPDQATAETGHLLGSSNWEDRSKQQRPECRSESCPLHFEACGSSGHRSHAARMLAMASRVCNPKMQVAFGHCPPSSPQGPLTVRKDR